MPRLLVVHHTPSPATQELLEAVLEGARHPELSDVQVVTRPALTAAAVDVLEADGLLLGTPANIGYMSGGAQALLQPGHLPAGNPTGDRALPQGALGRRWSARRGAA